MRPWSEKQTSYCKHIGIRIHVKNRDISIGHWTGKESGLVTLVIWHLELSYKELKIAIRTYCVSLIHYLIWTSIINSLSLSHTHIQRFGKWVTCEGSNEMVIAGNFIAPPLPVPHETECMKLRVLWSSSAQFSSVTQSCPTLCDPMNCSTPGLPVHHQLLEFTRTHVHWIGDAIQPSHLWSSPSPPALNLSQHQGLFQWVSPSHQVAKELEFQLQHQSFQWTPRTDLLSDGLAGSPCSPRDSQEFYPTPTVQKHQFFGGQLSL